MSDEEWSIHHNYEIAVRNLNSTAWQQMTDEEKIHDLQAIEDRNAMVQGRVACMVSAEPMAQGSWGYQQGCNIVINSNELSNPNFMEHIDTLFHEGDHAQVWQAGFLSEVQQNYTPQQLQELSAPIPDPNLDFQGYWNHPAEQSARMAGENGVKQVESDRSQIRTVDNSMPKMNQILETYDYLALGAPEPGSGAKGAQTAQNGAAAGTQAAGAQENMRAAGVQTGMVMAGVQAGSAGIQSGMESLENGGNGMGTQGMEDFGAMGFEGSAGLEDGTGYAGGSAGLGGIGGSGESAGGLDDAGFGGFGGGQSGGGLGSGDDGGLGTGDDGGLGGADDGGLGGAGSGGLDSGDNEGLDGGDDGGLDDGGLDDE